MRSRRHWLTRLAGLFAVNALAQRADAREDFATARARLVDEIEREMTYTASGTGRNRLSPGVRNAMLAVPREKFVPAQLADVAYANRPLPIGHGQTISQPFIVALMTELLDPTPSDVMLEVGTGSGYQAAVLAACVRKVYSIEILAPLAAQAKTALAAAGVGNVETRVGDGYRGWPDAAPFDGIIVTAAPDHTPPALVEQLKPGGRLVIPVGGTSFGQDLLVIRKDASGKTTTRNTIPVRFVPLTREK